MSTQANNNALSLHEILLSISDSLNEAQNQLRNMPPYDQYGRPNTLYQLPYLDFSLEVISEVSAQNQSVSEGNNVANLRSASKITNKDAVVSRNYQQLPTQALVFKPASPTTSNNSSSNKITSTISGRFVAIMPNEGLPQVFLTINAESNNGIHKFIAKMQLATGEPVVGQKVEINFDANNTQALNENLSGTVKFIPDNEGYTSQKGEFETSVEITGASPNQTFVFVANSGSIFKSVAITT
jgi:hypothetical protein